MSSQSRVNNDFYGNYVEAPSIVGVNALVRPFIQVRKTSTQNLTNNAYTSITNSNLTLVNKVGNISSNYADNNGSPLSVTINETGYYFVQANLWIDATNNVDRFRHIVRINYGTNTSSASGIGEEPTPENTNIAGNMSQIVVELVAGAQISFDVFVESALGQPIIVASNSLDNGIYRATFTVMRLF